MRKNGPKFTKKVIYQENIPSLVTSNRTLNFYPIDGAVITKSTLLRAPSIVKSRQFFSPLSGFDGAIFMRLSEKLAGSKKNFSLSCILVAFYYIVKKCSGASNEMKDIENRWPFQTSSLMDKGSPLRLSKVKDHATFFLQNWIFFDLIFFTWPDS